VSVPWRERFLEQGPVNEILPGTVPRVVIEAGSTELWQAFAGPSGAVIGVDRFGACGPGPEVMTRLGLSAEGVRKAAHDVIARATVSRTAVPRGVSAATSAPRRPGQ